MKRFLTLAMAAAVLTSLTACGNTAEATGADTIYGQIDSVSGNDIVLLLANYNENADIESTESAADDTAYSGSGETKRERPSGFSRPDNGEMPEGFDPSQFSGKMPEDFDPSDLPEGFDKSKFGGRSKKDSTDESGSEESGSGRKRPENFDPSQFSGKMPEGFDPSNFSGEMPEGFDPSNFSGEMPEGFDPSKFSGERPENFDSANMPEGFDRSKFGGSRSKSGKNSKYTLTGEQEELRVSVGTTVTTALGVETNFEVLKSGDMIQCTVEKDSDGNSVITAIKILE